MIKEKLLENIKPCWLEFINEEQSKSYFIDLMQFLEEEYTNKCIYPNIDRVLYPLKVCDIEDIKVVIIGQDPYHTPKVANGIAFSSQTIIPPSLKNIFKEIENEFGYLNTNPNLEPWLKQGVFLINNVLTVQQHQAKSHSNKGWEIFTTNLIKKLDHENMTFLLLGNDALKKADVLEKSFLIKAVHPSPLSAYRGFFNSNVFIEVNKQLEKNNFDVIDWRT